jgi:hypothetical protein
MAMVQVGQVGMFVHHGPVGVPVRVQRRVWHVDIVFMMRIGMGMFVLVFHHLVLVNVRMTLKTKETDRCNEKQSRYEVSEGDRIPKKKGREDEAEERGG